MKKSHSKRTKNKLYKRHIGIGILCGSLLTLGVVLFATVMILGRAKEAMLDNANGIAVSAPVPEPIPSASPTSVDGNSMQSQAQAKEKDDAQEELLVAQNELQLEAAKEDSLEDEENEESDGTNEPSENEKDIQEPGKETTEGLTEVPSEEPEKTDVIPIPPAVSGRMNGVWVATVLNLDYPNQATTDSGALKAQADAIIASCKELGFNNIFLQVRACSDAFYPSNIYPWSMYLTGQQGVAPSGDFDPLAYWIAKAHENGIGLHAWVNPYRVTKSNNDANDEYNKLSANNPAKIHPEYLLVHNKNYYFDPAIPEVRQLVLDGIREIVERYDVDGIHFDDYFYPAADFPDDASFAKYGAGYSDKLEWRRNNVNQLVAAINPLIKSIKPNVIFGISPSGIWANKSSHPAGSDTAGMQSFSQLAADSLKWAKEGWVDYICPQLYWEIGYSKADYQILARWWANNLQDTNTKLYIGIPDYRLAGAKSSSVWYEDSGVTQIRKQLELNQTIDKISGEIHFRICTINGQEKLKNFYKGR